MCERFREIVRFELTLRNKLIIWRGNQGKEEIPALAKNYDKITHVITFKLLEERKDPTEGSCLSSPTLPLPPNSRDTIIK